MKKFEFKKYLSVVPLIVILFSFFIFTYSTARAQSDEYTLLAPIPCVSGNDCSNTQTKTTLEQYIPGMFRLLIGLSAVVAVLRIVWGGFLYLSSDAVNKKKDGIELVQNSVKGLVLVIAAWLILNEINPNLLNINLNLEPVGIPSQVGAGGTLAGKAMTPEQIAASNAMRKFFADNGITTNESPCEQGQTSGCTNLNDLQQYTKDGILAFKTACGCSITITGGTEPGAHSAGSSHYSGSALDIRENNDIMNYVNKNGTFLKNDSYGSYYRVIVGSKSYIFLHEEDHWHISFN